MLVFNCSLTLRVLESVSKPAPSSPQKMHPLELIVPSRFGQVEGIFIGSLYTFSPYLFSR